MHDSMYEVYGVCINLYTDIMCQRGSSSLVYRVSSTVATFEDQIEDGEDYAGNAIGVWLAGNAGISSF